MRRSPLSIHVLALVLASTAAGCRTDDPDPVLDTSTQSLVTGTGFDPVAVGFGLDAVLHSDGTLTGYVTDGEQREPILALVFVSGALLAGGASADTDSCVALGRFDPQPRPASDPIPTDGGEALFVSWEAPLEIAASNCPDRVDPSVWGADARGLWEPFIGARLGYGLGPMTDALRASWPAEDLSALGDSMVASWVALTLDGTGGSGTAPWVASARTTGILFAWDEATGEPQTEPGPGGEPLLVAVDASGLVPGGPLPTAYIQSYPNTYADLASLDPGSSSDR